MARFLSTLLVLFLLGGTAAAFAVTEGLKLAPSPITGTSVIKTFSPRCECGQDSTAVDFKLRKADRLTITMIDANGREVRRLVERARFARGSQSFVWNGRTDDGAIAPDGEYRPRVHLARAHQTIVLPNPIRVDTTPPRTTLVPVIGLGASFSPSVTAKAAAVPPSRKRTSNVVRNRATAWSILGVWRL